MRFFIISSTSPFWPIICSHIIDSLPIDSQIQQLIILIGIVSERAQKKRESLYLLLVSRFEAFALPIKSKRATQKPTPYVYIYNLVSSHKSKVIFRLLTFDIVLLFIHTMSALCCNVPRLDLEFAKFRTAKNKASSKTPSYIKDHLPHRLPTSGFAWKGRHKFRKYL